MLTILQGDATEQLRTLPDESVHCCVTSPPYWGLRDYSANGQLGLEKTPEEYVAKMVDVFREVRRVLRKDGTLWLNFGDSYAHNGPCGGSSPDGDRAYRATDKAKQEQMDYRVPPGLKPKDLCGIPWRVAFALQADGWWLRSDIIWAKPNPMPESVTDRPTKAHEYLFLLTKSANYFYDAEAIKERVGDEVRMAASFRDGGVYTNNRSFANDATKEKQTHGDGQSSLNGRNKRSVWTVATAPYPEAHFATYPPDLIKPCILAGTSAKGCCAKCGSPWERIVEKVDTGRTQKMADGWDTGEGGHGTIHRNGREKGETGVPITESKTIGWQPTCKCERGDEKCDSAINAEASDTAIHNASMNRSRGTITFNPKLVPCTVLDPFFGSGTTGAVALELGRKCIGIELNPAYVRLAEQRCNITPGLQLA